MTVIVKTHEATDTFKNVWELQDNGKDCIVIKFLSHECVNINKSFIKSITVED